MATKTINTGKTFTGKYIEVLLPDQKNKPAFTSFHPRGYGFNIDFQVPFGDGGSPATCTVTISNVSLEHQKLFKKGDHIILKAGSKDLYGILSEGKITKVGREIPDGMDKSLQITFTEGIDYSKKDKIYSAYNGTKRVKHTYKTSDGKTITYYKNKTKKVNISFKKGVTAKSIIARICRTAGIQLDKLDLKKNKVYKKGYTLSSKPENAIKSIAKECGSKVYYRRGKLMVDDWEKPNPYNEHIYISKTTGLVGHPQFNDDDGTETMSVTTYLDPRISTGSIVEIVDKDTKVNGLFRVKSGEHDGSEMTTTMEVYA